MYAHMLYTCKLCILCNHPGDGVSPSSPASAVWEQHCNLNHQGSMKGKGKKGKGKGQGKGKGKGNPDKGKGTGGRCRNQ
jgi:hypothetical protein